jgi:tetratricopeptide (TPR) repeat protein
MAVLRRAQNRLSEAQVEAEIAISHDRNNELALKQLGQILLFQGEPLAGIPHLEKAIRLNPKGPNLWSIEWPLGQCHLLLGHVDQAVSLFRRACTARPGLYFLHLNLSGALGLRDDLEEAQTALAEALRLKPDVNSIARYRAATPWITNPKHWALRDQTLNVGLRQAGFPDE